MMKLAGRLQDEPLPILLNQLQLGRVTGVLHLETRMGRHELFLREGLPVGVELPGSAELLGNVLREMGIIDEAVHKRALAAPPPSGKRFGEWLLEQKLLAPDQLRLALKAQVRRKLHRLFFIAEGEFSFEEIDHQEGRQGADSLTVQPARAIYHGVRSAWSAEKLAAALFLLEGQAITYKLDGEALGRYGLGKDDGRVTELLRRGYWTVPDLIEAAALPAQPVHALLYALYVTDALEVRSASEVPRLKRRTDSGANVLPAAPAPAPAARVDSGAGPLPTAPAPAAGGIPRAGSPTMEIQAKAKAVENENLFEVLGIPDTATAEQVRNAYFDAAKRFHPDRVAALGLESLRADVEKIFRRVGEAYGVLLDDRQRAEYRATLGQPKGQEPAAHGKALQMLEAEMAMRRGEVLLKKGDYPGAVREFEVAVSGNPQEGEHLAYLTFARVCGGQLSWTDAKPRFQQATRLSPKCARAFYYFALALKEEKDIDRAYGNFRRALELDPRLLDAEREMRVINMRKSKDDKKGLFDRFRKK